MYRHSSCKVRRCSQVSAAGGYAFNAGVGDKARADARVILEGVVTTVQQSRTAKSDYVVWQSMANSGSNTQTLALPSFAGGGTFSAPGGLSVQLPDGDFKRQITSLSQQPGMGYLNDLAARKDVNWQPVKLAHDQWNYSQSGLTPAGAALLAVAVTWATGGMGASLIGGTVTTTTATGATLTTTTLAGTMANAAFTSLAAQASITLVNNKGDIGKTLKDMGTSSTVKATLAAVLTAGVLDKLGTTSTMTELSRSGGFADKLTYNLINATGRALTTTAINGGDLQGALKSALIGGLVDTAQGQAASLIKGLEGDYLAHKLAHALAGCVAGAAAGGQCKDGAIGGAVGEMVAEMLPKPGSSATASEINAFNGRVLAYSKLVAGAVSAYAGGNAQTAITAAEVAVKNNFCGYNGCANRRFNWNDAVDQWRNGKGVPVTGVNANELNLTDATYTKNGDGTIQIHTSLKFDTGAIYGTVTGVFNSDGSMSIKPDTYNFDLKNPLKANSMEDAGRLFLRNTATGIGLAVNGYGVKYEIQFTGSIPAPKELPK